MLAKRGQQQKTPIGPSMLFIIVRSVALGDHVPSLTHYLCYNIAFFRTNIVFHILIADVLLIIGGGGQ